MRTIYLKRDFDHHVDEYLTIAYKAGNEVEVEEDVAAKAVAIGSAEYSDFAEDDLIDGRVSDFDEDEDA